MSRAGFGRWSYVDSEQARQLIKQTAKRDPERPLLLQVPAPAAPVEVIALKAGHAQRMIERLGAQAVDVIGLHLVDQVQFVQELAGLGIKAPGLFQPAEGHVQHDCEICGAACWLGPRQRQVLEQGLPAALRGDDAPRPMVVACHLCLLIRDLLSGVWPPFSGRGRQIDLAREVFS